MKKAFIYIASFMGLGIIVFGFVDLFLDAAIREQDFNDAIRLARCERMDEHTRAYMKGYCK